MRFIDIFNGDADGLCALQQLRLSQPVDSELITGVKRDISLLKRVKVTEDTAVTVLDISLDKNREPLIDLLRNGVQVSYFDHHFAGDIPMHPGLQAHIDLSAETCTSMVVNDFLNGSFRAWAVVGAFGDNLALTAQRLAEPLELTVDRLVSLRQLGEYLNYNAYGETVQDLYFHPAELSQRMRPHVDPIAFIHDDSIFTTLHTGYAEDMAKALTLRPECETVGGAVYFLPDTTWSRRVSGVFSNRLALDHPGRAHAILNRNSVNAYTVSVRAPLANMSGADDLCRQFDTGGGRKGAAGINNLSEEKLAHFFAQFSLAYPGL